MGTHLHTACLALLALAPIVRSQVEDEAKLFSPEAVAEANKRIVETKQKTGKGFILATVPSVPQELAKEVNFKDASQRRKFFAQWVEKRARAAHLDGVYALVCQDPKHIEIAVYPPESDRYFSEWYRHQLFKLLVKRLQPDNPDQGALQELSNKLRTPRPDEGLLEAVDYVDRKLEWNRPPDMSVWYWSMGVIGATLVAWLVLNVMRSKLRRRTPRDAGILDRDESGISVAVLGGAVGAVTGQWLVDRLFRRRAAEPAAPLVSDDTPPEADPEDAH